MLSVLTQMMDRDDMGDRGGHWWWLVAVVLLVVGVGAVAYLVAHAAGNPAPLSGAEPSRRSAEDVLADRFARGDIDEDEYRRRRDVVRD